jgi:hypothetical protein
VGHEWEIVQNLSLNDFSRRKIDASVNELREEQELVAELLGLDRHLGEGYEKTGFEIGVSTNDKE